jgi:DNA-binding NarL/FixJ family response regulator
MSPTMSPHQTRVLLVDDNEAMLARTAAVLTPGCLVVGTATDGRAALEAATALRPDVIVLDISMPGVSGLEIASSLHEAGSTAAVVFLSIYNEEAFVTAATAAGGTGYVVKRRIESDLLLAVQEALAGRPFVSSLAAEPVWFPVPGRNESLR